MGDGKSSGIALMTYDYILTFYTIDEEIFYVQEFEKGKINGKKWTMNEIKNYEMIGNYSLTRTKNWVFQNHPELLL
jgi:hypothetical protein